MAAADFQEKLLQGLGGEWPAAPALNPKTKSTVQKEGYRIETLTYEAEPGDAIPALLLIPDTVTPAHPHIRHPLLRFGINTLVSII